mmetsp:Transcript_87075/g.254820  ORF Transcript_87075/g.254820 Transcript_87075/m.254820 type:complete len:232 (+) Transcript_87075:113-808(+)
MFLLRVGLALPEALLLAELEREAPGRLDRLHVEGAAELLRLRDLILYVQGCALCLADPRPLHPHELRGVLAHALGAEHAGQLHALHQVRVRPVHSPPNCLKDVIAEAFCDLAQLLGRSGAHGVAMLGLGERQKLAALLRIRQHVSLHQLGVVRSNSHAFHEVEEVLDHLCSWAVRCCVPVLVLLLRLNKPYGSFDDQVHPLLGLPLNRGLCLIEGAMVSWKLEGADEELPV